MDSTAIHHPIGFCIGNIQGSSEVIIHLHNGGSSILKYMYISCLTARTPLLLFFVCKVILLFLLAVWLNMPLFVIVMAS
jgi:hypothetical protein